jgi:hypothetical protein
MTPALANLIRATALLSQVPASGVLRDGVREALAVVDAETARGLNAPRSPAHVDTVVAEVRADLLARSAAGIAKYGVTLDRKDLGHAQWLQHGYEEALDLACYLKRAMRDLPAAAPVEPPHASAPFLRPLTPEPAEAVLGRAGEALAEPRSPTWLAGVAPGRAWEACARDPVGGGVGVGWPATACACAVQSWGEASLRR